MRMRIQDLSGWLDLTYRRPKIDDLWSSSDDGSRVSQPSAQVRTLLPPIFKGQSHLYGVNTVCTGRILHAIQLQITAPEV